MVGYQNFNIHIVCHHAGGPLTKGELKDIEDLGNITVVLCPWHKFMVDIKTGLKAYKQVEIINNLPVYTGWKVGKLVQRAHIVKEEKINSKLCILVQLNKDDIVCPSDGDTCKVACMRDYHMHPPAVKI